MVNSAVLFETFARPVYARQVFDQIKKAQPKKLYFYSNKARIGYPEEMKNNEEIRSWVKEIDWDCELHTFFSDEYVDIYVSTLGSKDWVFKNEEEAIVLEDDSIPSIAFFEYCDFFLNKYRDDKNVGFISGANYAKNYKIKNDVDHIYSDMFYFYGFATWRDRWQNINVNITSQEVISQGLFENYFYTRRAALFFQDRFDKLADFIDRTHCWDYVFMLNCIKDKSYGVYPIVNLVKNIGVVGTHSDSSILRLSNNVYQNDFYPFTSQNLGEYDDDFEKDMLKKTQYKTFRSRLYGLLNSLLLCILGKYNLNRLKLLIKRM